MKLCKFVSKKREYNAEISTSAQTPNLNERKVSINCTLSCTQNPISSSSSLSLVVIMDVYIYRFIEHVTYTLLRY